MTEEKTFATEKSIQPAEQVVRKRILVVDDDPDIRTMLRIMLEFKGYSVVDIERGEASEEMLLTNEFGLVVMDMLLSGVNGVDICSQIKQNRSISHIPIVMISAHPNAKKICLEAGADDFIAKPFDMQEILTVVGRLMPV